MAKRLAQERNKLKKAFFAKHSKLRITPLEDISLDISVITPYLLAPCNDDSMFDWIAAICGPEKSVYENGVWYMSIKVPFDYPVSPPICKFLTPIHHANISRDGAICVDILSKDRWGSILNLEQIVISIISLLTDPNFASPMNSSAIYEDDKSKERFKEQVQSNIDEYASKSSLKYTFNTKTFSWKCL